MKTLLLLLVAPALALAACESYEGPTRAEGQVVDRHTGQAVPNATVQVVGIASGLGAGGTSQGNAFPADAQGRFAFTFEASATQNYTLFAATPTGYASNFDAPLLKSGHKNTGLVVKAAAPAWVKIICVDDPPLGKVGLYTSGYNGLSDTQNVGPGNFSFVRPTSSNSPSTLTWRITNENGQDTHTQQAYSVASFDTATVTVHF